MPIVGIWRRADSSAWFESSVSRNNAGLLHYGWIHHGSGEVIWRLTAVWRLGVSKSNCLAESMRLFDFGVIELGMINKLKAVVDHDFNNFI